MNLNKSFRTELLSDDETLRHRLVVAGQGRKWECDCCAFEEAAVVAWTPVKGGDIRLSCLECHPYEDPWRYENTVAAAWLPKHSVPVLSNLIRLLAATSSSGLASWLLAEVKKKGDPGGDVQRLLAEVMHVAYDRGTGTAPAKNMEDFDYTAMSWEVVESVGGATSRWDKRYAALNDSLEGAFMSFSRDIADGIEASEQAFKGFKLQDLIIATENGPACDRTAVKAGLRFIPAVISSSRIKGWSGMMTSVKKTFYDDVEAMASANGGKFRTIASVVVEDPPTKAEKPAVFEGQVVERTSDLPVVGGE